MTSDEGNPIAARPSLMRYSIATIAVLVASVLREALNPLIGFEFPLLTFFPAVMVSAWFGGFWPGIVSTILSTAVTVYLWIAPEEASRGVRTGDIVALTIFIGVGVMISALNESLHRGRAKERAARQRAERDEEALRRSEERLRVALTNEETANQIKDRFLAIVSHELRTPLNAMLGWADMLRSGALAEDRRGHAVEAVYTNAKRQAQLVDELLDKARIMAGKLRLDRTEVDLHDVARGVIEILQPAADAKRIRIDLSAGSAIGPLYADGARLQQILLNLMTNALKFTPPGGSIDLRLQRSDSMAEIAVTDTGSGIAREFLPFIFEPFQQADEPTTRLHGGLGLGLSIVRHLVEAHGGTIRAASNGENKGSTFTVRLPILVAPGRVEEPAPVVAAPPPSLAGISVLVVDDDVDSREIVEATLRRSGATVRTAASAAEALVALMRHPVDVLLADIAMPGEDGYSLIQKVRSLQSARLSRVPAAALTSFAREEDRRRAVEAGFQLHLAKPVEPGSLIAAVAALASGTSL
jgi:signal transduction histidine kinase/CheY-like chemotaxis protein